MSGELKSENINNEKAPTQQSHHPARSLNCPIEYYYIPARYYSRTLIEVLLAIEHNSSMNYKDPQDQRPSWIAVHSWTQYPTISTTP
jgi:hypothetical protein